VSTATTSRRFGEKLKAEFESRNMGARTLARVLARREGDTRPNAVENRRRAIIKWLQGATPIAENRHKVEDALELPRDSLKGDDEDEEADPMAITITIDYALLARAIEAARKR
jgi:hypothetical protein